MNQNELFVREIGTGPAVLLLPGAPMPADHLLPLANALATRRKVLLPDMPGYGRSPWPAGHYTLAAAHGALESWLSEHTDGVIDVCGLSLGAYRALQLALSPHLTVRRVVTIGGFASLPVAARDGFRQLAAAWRAGIDLRDVFAARMLTPGFAAEHPDAIAEVRSWLDLLPRERLADELTAAADCPDLAPRLKQSELRLLARVGELDAAAPPPLSQHMVESAAAKATLQIVRGTGHLLLLEDFAATTAAIGQFLS